MVFGRVLEVFWRCWRDFGGAGGVLEVLGMLKWVWRAFGDVGETLERLQVFWRCHMGFGGVKGVFKKFWRSQRGSKVSEGFWKQSKILGVVEILQKFGGVGEVLKVLKIFWKCWKIFGGA